MTCFPLYLMRHGETALAGRMVGHLDCDVLTSGVADCARQAAGLDVERIVASDLMRARRSAEAVGRTAIDPRWRELDFGAWDGCAASELPSDALGRFWDDPDANPPPGGERWSALVARVAAAIADLPPVPTLIVTHGGPMRAALHHLCGFSIAQCCAFDLPCASLLSLSVWDGDVRTAQITGLRSCAA